MSTPGFTGQNAQSADDVSLAVMIDRVHLTIFFDNYQAGPPLNNVCRIFDGPLYDKSLAGFNMPKGHFVKERTAILLNDELKEFRLAVCHSLLIQNHLVEITATAG
jgi:hypothetical protein